MRNSLVSLAAAAAFAFGAAPVLAQSATGSSQWFVPKTTTADSTAPAAKQAGPRQTQQAAAPAEAQVGLPPLPAVPDFERGTTPPAAVIGVLDVNGVVQVSTAYQALQKEFAARQAKMNADAQQEQTVIRGMNQTLTEQQKVLSQAQFEAKQKDLQDKIAQDNATFSARKQRDSDAANYASAQIEQALNAVVNKVAYSRGINLVVAQSQLFYAVPEFNISQQVAVELNKILPASQLKIPPEGVDVAAYARSVQAKK